MPSNIKVFLYLLPVVVCQLVKDDICKKVQNDRFCPWYDLRWTYDAVVHECHHYYGCDTVGNIYETEDLCYSKCYEKLIELHPPQNVTAAYTHDKVYLYWYPPINYVLHEPDINNGTSNNGNQSDTNDIKVTTNPPSKSEESTVATVNTTDKTDTSNTSVSNTTIVSNNSTSNSIGVKNGTAETGEKTGTVDTGGKTGAADTVEKDVTADNGEKNGTAEAGEKNGTPSTVAPKGDELLPGTNYTLSDFYGKTKVPFHFANLTHYNISIKLRDGKFLKNITVPGNSTEYQIPGLLSSAEYEITVSAIYITRSVISAPTLILTMRQDPSMAQNCYCDQFGSKEGKKPCNLSLTQMPWCNCKYGYAGLFCEVCANGFYRTALSLPCHKCPCPLHASTGSCHFVEGYLHCMTCKQEYAGNLCHRCGNGYYRNISHVPSKCIKCKNCHGITPGKVCDEFTGNCLNCYYNTTGDQCEKCKDGFVGDPLQNIPCKHIGSEHSGYHPPAVGVIVAVVLGIIVLLSGVVGFIIYKRRHNFPPNRPFWTIEFKEDHDKVNFSAVPEDEIERQHDDMAFYETQNKNKTKLPPYSQLREEM
ncbi:Basement membrane-specific heparan sulfate proteoglycan core protein [Mactra antiquata]